MLIKFNLQALRGITASEYAYRFVLGGTAVVATGLIAQHYGAVIGGLFLALPAIFPASATLVEQHEREKKQRAGIPYTIRGRLSAALDARGAVMGACALVIFAFVIWKLLPANDAAAVLSLAAVAWVLCAALLWRLRRWHTRFWIWRHAR